MRVYLGDETRLAEVCSVRINLAGAELPWGSELLRDLQYPFRLASYYYVAHDNTRGGPVDRLKEFLDASNDGSDWILDSGLFTLMFGADKGKLTTYDQYRDYALKYREDVESWGWKHPIVECDVQRVLGVDECMRIREEVFSDYRGTVIYVWHIPEGIEGLKLLAAKHEYIALSVPELRVVYKTPSAGGSQVKRALTELLAIAKVAGSDKVHLLGCTENDLLRLPAYSADSTSWYSSGRYGTGYILERGKLRSVSVYSPKYDAWRKWIVEHPRWRDGFAKIKERQGLKSDNPEYYESVAVGAATFQLLMEIINGE